MNEKNIGHNIQVLRCGCDMTQAELAKRTQKGLDYIIETETGSHVTSVDFLLKICDALEVTPNDILAGEYLPDCGGENTISPRPEQSHGGITPWDTKVSGCTLLRYFLHFYSNQKEK